MIKKFFLPVLAFLLFSFSSNAKSSSVAPSISMIGDALSGWSTDVDMSSTDGVNFTLENFTFKSGGAKFRQNADWGTNWGANVFPSGISTLNGNNIPVTLGTYNVTFNITTGAFSFTSVVNYDAISISGTAGPGLNSDVSMITGDGIKYFLGQYTLKSGTLIFRKDNSSTTTWGSATFPSGTAAQGGSAITVSPGTYDITFNKTTGVFSFDFATIGIIGSGTAGGWNTDTLLTTNDGVNYTLDGAVLTTGELKFRKDQSWTIAWGGSGFPTGTASLSGSNIGVSGGIYSISFNTKTGGYTFVSGYPVVSLFKNGGTDINLFTTDGENYFLNNYSISAGDYNFRQSGTSGNTWGAISFPSGTATLGGSSIPVLAGDYNIVFNKVTGVFSFNYLTVGVIGSATPNGWSANTNLSTEDGVNYKLSGLTLGLGELKFRQGDNWDVNWGGGTFPRGTSTRGGSNIAVSKASNFTATFNRLTGVYNFYDEVNLDAISTLNLCKGSVVTSLSSSVFAVPGSVVKWYTTATGGKASLIAPSPATSIIGTKTYYVSQTIGGIEGPRALITVNIIAVPTEVLGAISSNTAGTTVGTFAPATLAVGQFVGTTTTVSYRVPEFVGTDSYYWTVPAGVSIVGQAAGTRAVTQTGTNANVLNVNYSGVAAGVGSVGSITVQAQNAGGCNGTAKSVIITKVLPTAPAAIVMNDLSLPTPVSGIPSAVTSFAKYMGTDTVLRLTATPSATATSYQWDLPTGVNQLSGGTNNVITVNFAGVTSANSFNFNTAAGISTNVLRIGVKAVNGVGVSTTSNTALVNPTTTSTAKVLTLTAVAPAAPILKMFDMAVSSTVAVTDISKYIGTPTPLTLVGSVAATSVASSFSWELADGVNVVEGSLTSNSITVNFEDVSSGTASLYVGIKAVNGMGSSIKNNSALLPATASTATLLKLTAAFPSVAGAVVGSLAICSNKASSVTYTITAAASKTSLYFITSPAGTTIDGGAGNTAILSAVANATFTVNYPSGFTSVKPTQKSISIQSVNGFGVSATNKVLALTSNACTAAVRVAKEPLATEFKVIAYPNPSSGVFNLAIESSNTAATTIQVFDMQGRMIENKKVNANAVEIGANYTSGIYNVILENAGQAKTIRLIKK